jgi:GIY-YIG catalytic domain
MTLQEELQRYETSRNQESQLKRASKARDRSRKAYFCIGYSSAWTTPIHVVIKQLETSLGLSWLRISTMSYHRFANLRETFQQDLYSKIMAEVVSLDYKNLPCNCSHQESDSCKYNNVCRHSLVVYKVECKSTGKVYIGNTQQHLKKRMGQHARHQRRPFLGSAPKMWVVMHRPSESVETVGFVGQLPI